MFSCFHTSPVEFVFNSETRTLVCWKLRVWLRLGEFELVPSWHFHGGPLRLGNGVPISLFLTKS